jgi:hypothetical protein
MGTLCSTFESKLVHNLHFWSFLQKLQKAAVTISVCLSACVNSATSGQMCVKFDIGDLNLLKIPIMVKVWQKY